MVDGVIANYYVSEGNIANYSVRLVNHTSAYDWLSEEMMRKITQARQTVRLDLEMEDLLLLAILVENGGVVMRHYDTLLRNALDWVEEGFLPGK